MNYISATLLFLFSSSLIAADEPLLSQVFSWSEPLAAEASWKTELPIRDARTLDFTELDVDAVTLPPGKTDTGLMASVESERIIMVLEGEVTITLNNGSETVGAGSVALVQPGDSYHILNSGAVPASYYLMQYTSVKGCSDERRHKAGASFIVEFKTLEPLDTGVGYRWQNFDQPTCMVDHFDFHTSSVRNGQTTHAPHTHRVEEMIIVLKGEVEMLIGEEHLKGHVGDLFYVAANVPHSLNNIGNETTQYYAFQWHISQDSHE